MEVLSESVRLANLPFTILLACVIVYWLVMSFGLLDFDSGTEADVDMHIDTDADVHVETGADMHAEADADLDGEIDSGWSASFFQFLNIGEVPLMVVLSIMSLSAWTLSMALNHYWNNGSIWRAGLLLVPNLIVTCLITHFLTRPFKSLFKALNREYEEHVPMIGRTCTITTSEASTEFGQAQIETRGAPLLINVRTSGDAVLRKGDTGLVIKEDKAKSIYTIVKVTTDKLEA